MKTPYKVAVILDRDFGKRVFELLPDGPAWVIESPANRAAAETWWKRNPGADHLDGVTVFNSNGQLSSEDTLISWLDTIDLHHGEHSAPEPYSILDIVGTSGTPKLATALAECGFGNIEARENGFRASRL